MVSYNKHKICFLKIFCCIKLYICLFTYVCDHSSECMSLKIKGFVLALHFTKGSMYIKKPVWLILFCCSWKLNIDYFSIINLRFVLQEENIWVIILRTKSGPDSKHWNWFLYLDILHSCSKPPGYVVLVPRHAGII